jgi:FKBP-type peptidyl-prolyl cis-trans isomerase
MPRILTRHQDQTVHMRLRQLSAALLPLAFTACLSGSDYNSSITAPSVPIEQTTFASALNVDLSQSTKTASGMYIRDLTVGTDPVATSTSTVSTYYEGFLATGYRFGYNLSPSDPYVVKIGAKEVIPGWEEGLVGMKVGGKRQLVIPPELAYGPYGSGPIPSNAVIVFNVEVVAVE